jgi:mannose-6-phosphate isomerase-like protein (cupin superfamily)
MGILSCQLDGEKYANDLARILDLAKTGEGKARIIWVSRSHERSIYTVEMTDGTAFDGSHVHEKQDETLYVIEGRRTMIIANEAYTFKSGDKIFIPTNTKHRLVKCFGNNIHVGILRPGLVGGLNGY